MNRKLSPAWTLAILTGLNLFNYVDRYVLSAVVTPLQAELHINDNQAGTINSAFMIGYFVTSPFFGYLGDRFSRKWLIALGIFVWSLGTVLTGFASTFALLLAFRVLVGLGEASYATLSPGLISDSFVPQKRNNAFTIFYVAIPVGAALGTFLGGEIANHYSWRHAFIWTGAPGLLLALVLLPFREPARGETEGKTAQGAAHPSVIEVLKLFLIPKYLLVVLGYTAYTFALGAFGFWGPSFLLRVRHVSLENSGIFFGAILAIAGLVGTFAGGFASTAWHKRNRAAYPLTLALSVLLAVPFVVLTFVVHDTSLSIVCLAISMVLLFICTGPVNTIIIEAVPVNLRSSAMALSIFMIHLFGDMFSSKIVGQLSDQWHSLQKAVLILPVMLLVCGLLWLALVARTLKEDKPKPSSV
ncbi:MAG: Major facilitator superfamily 1 [Pedosphaera sp.]|nr:Major facilitator superfamily 1 [Pedosphaera sp.]